MKFQTDIADPFKASMGFFSNDKNQRTLEKTDGQ